MNYELLIDAIEDVHPAFIAFGIGIVTGLIGPELGVVRIGIIAAALTVGIKVVLRKVTDASEKGSTIN